MLWSLLITFATSMHLMFNISNNYGVFLFNFIELIIVELDGSVFVAMIMSIDTEDAISKLFNDVFVEHL